MATVESTASTTSGGGGTSTSTPAFVQGNVDSVNGSVTLPNSVTSGNLIVVGITVYGATTSAGTVTDNKGNTYTKIAEAVNNVNGGDHAALFYAKNVTGGSSFTAAFKHC